MLIATHELLQGRRARSVLPGHRDAARRANANRRSASITAQLPGHAVATRALAVYEHIARHLATSPGVAR